MSDEWQRVCILCAPRGRTKRLESGHCCVECASWLTTQVADIARLAADAAAWVTPGSSHGWRWALGAVEPPTAQRGRG
jgi:hypothetical protein